MGLEKILEWDQAGPVAILMFVCVCLVYLTRWLLRELLRDKDAQIAQLSVANDKLRDEIGKTLNHILDAVRNAAPTKGGDRS